VLRAAPAVGRGRSIEMSLGQARSSSFNLSSTRSDRDMSVRSMAHPSGPDRGVNKYPGGSLEQFVEVEVESVIFVRHGQSR
jgi:hypothetical protein